VLAERAYCGAPARPAQVLGAHQAVEFTAFTPRRRTAGLPRTRRANGCPSSAHSESRSSSSPTRGWAALCALGGGDPGAARADARVAFSTLVKDRPELRLAFSRRDHWAPLLGGAEAEGLIQVVFGPLQAALHSAD
jgi:hypothetical protein